MEKKRLAELLEAVGIEALVLVVHKRARVCH
jgi:hypothetical protein